MSRFAHKLARGEFLLTLEITPPQKWLPSVLRRRASGLGERADAVDVIQRGGRIPSVAASRWLRRQGFEPVWHLVTHGRSRPRIEAEIGRARQAGLRLALCMRGDHRAEPAREGVLVREAVTKIRHEVPEALVGVTFDPYAPRERALRQLERKLDAGACFVQTQPVFSPEVLGPVADAISRRRWNVALIPMLIPLLSIESARRLERRLGISLPSRWHEALRQGGAVEGWRLFEENLQGLRRAGHAAGATIMTFEMDPPIAVLDRLAKAVDTQSARSPRRTAPLRLRTAQESE
jgi:5,10-methylenetetrahydrofolate reductase